MAQSCRSYSIPDGDPRYSRPLPWIGLYVAAASMACAVCMVFDFYHSLRKRRLWISPNLFSLNAVTLTILSIATKLPSDMTTAMPGLVDQFAKLSGILLVCIVMNHVMPSLGHMSGLGIVSNVAALGILVVTISVNIWTQTGTLVLSTNYDFYYMYIYSSIHMMIMLVIFVSYSVGVIPTKKLLKERYNSRHRRITSELMAQGLERNRISVEVIKSYVNKYWILALTSSPDYILGCSGMSMVNAILCHTTVLGMIYSYVSALSGSRRHRLVDRPCLVYSYYRWSTPMVLFFQTVTIVVGTLGSFLRSCFATPTRGFCTWESLFKVERQWLLVLLEWKEAPLPLLQNKGRKARKLAHLAKRLVFDFFLKIDIGVFFIAKLYLLLNKLFLVLIIEPVILLFKRATRKIWHSDSHEENSSHDDLKDYVLHLEEDEDDNYFASKVVQAWKDYPQRWTVNMRSSDRPTSYLLHFLENQYAVIPWELLEYCFHTNTSESQPSKCWSLPLTVLVVIHRIRVGNASRESMERLMRVVHEGFRYVRFVEKNMASPPPRHVQEAADMVWEEIDLYGRWLDVDLYKLGSGWIESMESLRVVASKQVEEELRHKSRVEWSRRGLVAYCMTKIVGFIQARIDSEDARQIEEHISSEWIERWVALLIVDCFRNLPFAVLRRCWNGEFGKREEGVREATLVLGEVEDILLFLYEITEN